MVEFINKYTGGKMLVHESRAAEYEAKGYVRSSEIIAEVTPVEVEPLAIEEKPKSTAKRPRKRDPKEW